MGNSNAAVGMELPGFTASDFKGIQTVGTVKGGQSAAQTVISDFKKKLYSLATAQSVTAQTPGALPEDIVMAMNTTGQEEPLQMGVGILEGFGLLDGQTDIGAVSVDAASNMAASAQTAEAVEQAQTSGQFAGMLNQGQPGTTAADMPQQSNVGIGEYSSSLESTNSAAMDATGDEMAMRQLQFMLAAGTAQAETQAKAQMAEAWHQAQAEAQNRMAASHEALSGAQADTKQPAAQLMANGTAAEGTAAEQQPLAANLPQATEDDAQAQPAAKFAPASADGAETSALQGDTPVKADAASNTAQTAESTFVRDNVIRIVDKASAYAREGRYEFDVELKPDFLGKVSIRLTMQDGEIRMQIMAEDPMVRGMFADQANALANAMKEKGIILSGVDVSYHEPMTAGGEAFTQSGHGGGSRKRENQISWMEDRYGSEAIEALTPELLGGSSVEYLA